MIKRIRYIINPKSGTKGKEEIPLLIEKLTNRNEIDVEICLTKAAKHATELAQEAALKNYDIVVAVGGDGSANETAKGLLGSNTAMGIIPTGSGNGMARHLKIPMDASEAIMVINKAHLEKIDTITVNNEFCLGTIGIGFDAHIAHLFSQAKTRGYSTYVKLVLTEFYKYKSKLILLNVDGKEIKRECFLLTFANSSQFGNNAVIAPFADVQDGIIEVSMMSKFPVFAAPHLIYRLMNNIIHQSRYFDMAKGKSIIVKNQGELQGHIDGEPVTFHGDLNIQIFPSSLSMVVNRGL
ncbi:diacylglycerol kinase family lipid kinase [soil metagenome]